jgi:hypothetical protein
MCKAEDAVWGVDIEWTKANVRVVRELAVNQLKIELGQISERVFCFALRSNRIFTKRRKHIDVSAQAQCLDRLGYGRGCDCLIEGREEGYGDVP